MITPQDVMEYTVFEDVKSRAVSLLDQDILEAQVEITEITGHGFSDPEYNPLPPKAKLAFLKMTQFFALINGDESIVKGYTSEKMGDYSYQLGNGSTIRKPDVFSLLKEYITKTEPLGTTKIRMRSL